MYTLLYKLCTTVYTILRAMQYIFNEHDHIYKSS